jgi:hypothetical protein
MFHFDNVSISSTVLTVIQHFVYTEITLLVECRYKQHRCYGLGAVWLYFSSIFSLTVYIDTTCRRVCETYLVNMAFCCSFAYNPIFFVHSIEIYFNAPTQSWKMKYPQISYMFLSFWLSSLLPQQKYYFMGNKIPANRHREQTLSSN